VHFNFVRHFYSPPTEPGGRLLPDLHPLTPEDLEAEPVKIGDPRIPKPTAKAGLNAGDTEYRLFTKLGHALDPALAKSFGHDGYGSYNRECSSYTDEFKDYLRCSPYPVQGIKMRDEAKEGAGNGVRGDAKPANGGQANGGQANGGLSNGGQANGEQASGGGGPRSDQIRVDIVRTGAAVAMTPLPTTPAAAQPAAAAAATPPRGLPQLPIPVKVAPPSPAAAEAARLVAPPVIMGPEGSRPAEPEPEAARPAALRSGPPGAGAGAPGGEEEELLPFPVVLFDSEDCLPVPVRADRVGHHGPP
jgi:hypothetical protein